LGLPFGVCNLWWNQRRNKQDKKNKLIRMFGGGRGRSDGYGLVVREVNRWPQLKWILFHKKRIQGLEVISV
jgi:hypothetical protein